MKERDVIIQDTLGWVNEIRGGLGANPLECLRAGSQRLARECPISRSLETPTVPIVFTSNFGSIVLHPRGGAPILIDAPAPVRLFIKAFDRGEIPWLMEENTAEVVMSALLIAESVPA